jgi:hypothetical protein
MPVTLFERVEKKIFFRIVRSITFFVAFLALIATIAGLYTSVNTSMEAKPKSVQVAKEEIDSVLKPEPKDDTTVNNDANKTVTVEEDPEQAELKKLAESIAKRLLASQDTLPDNPNYNEALGKTTDEVLGTLSDYDHETKISALTQLDELSKTFTKNKFLDNTNVFLALFKSKYAHEQALVDQKNLADQANKMMGYAAVGAGIVTFALFVMILVLLRIEKNTRPSDSENDEYDTTDKKLLIGIVGFAIAIAVLIGWGVNQSFGADEEFDPVAELRPSYANATVEAAPAATEEVAPAAEEAAPAADAAAYDATAPAADATENNECRDAQGNWICE